MLFDHTKAAADLILEDMRAWGRRFRIVFAVLTTLYMLYAILADVGFLVLNCVLFALYVAYTVYSFLTYKSGTPRKGTVWLGYRWVRIALRSVTLGTALYGMYEALVRFDGLALLLGGLSVIAWMLEVVITLLVTIAEPKLKLIYAGFLEDTRPVNRVLGVLKGEDTSAVYDEHRDEIDRLSDRLSRTRRAKPNPLSHLLGRLARRRRGDIVLDEDAVSTPTAPTPPDSAACDTPALPPSAEPRSSRRRKVKTPSAQ